MASMRASTATAAGSVASRSPGAIISTLFREFIPTVLTEDGKVVAPGKGEQSWWLFVELKFCVRSMLYLTSRQLVTEATITGASLSQRGHSAVHLVDSERSTDEQSRSSADSSRDLLDSLDVLDREISDAEKAYMADTPVAEQPRILRYAKKFGLAPVELDIMQLTVVEAAGRTKALGGQLSFYADYHQERTKTRALCRADRISVQQFLHEDRKHMKDGQIVLDEPIDDNADRVIQLTVAACAAFLGMELTTDHKLKLADTGIMEIIQEERPSNGHQRSQGGTLSPSAAGTGADALDSTTGKAAEGRNSTRNTTGKEAQLRGSADKAASPSRSVTDGGLDDLVAKLLRDENVGGAEEHAKAGSSLDDVDGGDISALIQDTQDLTPYTDSLLYLEDQFQKCMQSIKISQERFRRDMDAHEDDVDPWDRVSRGNRVNVREFETRYRLLKHKIQSRLTLTRKANLPMPRLEHLANVLNLDPFEKDVLILIVAANLSPVVQQVLKSRLSKSMNSLQVKDILHILCSSFQEMVSRRIHFYKSAALCARGLIRLRPEYHGFSNDLTQHVVVIDRRILDWVAGLDTEIQELVEGSNLYTPKTSFDDVVLPEDLKKALLEQVSTFDLFKQYQRRHELHDMGPTTTGLVILFHGPSGTGKTMTVNALGTRLKKKVLLINFGLMSQQQDKSRGDQSQGVFQSLFREAEMNDAIVFFDECESLFSQRGQGGSLALTELLTEMERFRGMVFLATNRLMDLDEAMYRRIHSVFEFHVPSHMERKAIWKVHTGHQAIRVADDVDWEFIALKYDLTGGFIKNAVTAALMLAISKDGIETPVITQDQLVEGCSMQMRGSLQMKTFSSRVVPKHGLERMTLNDDQLKALEQIVALEKARPILFGHWGFDESMRAQQSTAAMFWGPPGSGKTTAAEALAFEVGQPIKLVNLNEFLQSNSSRSSSKTKDEDGPIARLFKDASLMNAVLVFDNCGPVLDATAKSEQAHQALADLCFNMERYPGIVILQVTSHRKLSLTLHHMEKDFLRRFKFFVEFPVPTPNQRTVLWKKMLPEAVPREDKLDLDTLGSRFEFTGGQIGRVVYRACAAAALRSSQEQKLTQADLSLACQEEDEKALGDVERMVRNYFL